MDTVHIGFPLKSRDPELGDSASFKANLSALERDMTLSLKIAHCKHDLEGWWGKEQSGVSILGRDTWAQGQRGIATLELPSVLSFMYS